jgi:outer membrane protein OmpA-like peptidoglycan-associated protein
MANSMMDSILGMVTPEMKQALASRLGTSAQTAESGLSAATAATLGGLANKAQSDSGFLGQVFGLLGGGTGQNLLSGLSSIASNGPAGGTAELVNRFLPMVFGSQQGQITNSLSNQFGLSAASGLGLFKMAVPLVMAWLWKGHSAGTLTSSSLANMLRTEAANVQGYAPSGVLTGAAAFGGAAAPTAPTGYTATARASPRWLVPVVIAAALLLGWALIRSMTAPRQAVQTAANVTANAVDATRNAATAAWAKLGELIRVTLPDGTVLNVPSLGVEGRLVNFLNSTAPASDRTWFDFDRLLFDTNSATLQPASQEQLRNIAAILRAYPNVKVRIGGYTDNIGDPAANVTLSQQRANSVVSQLVSLGVDPSRMTAQGYGQDSPVADNSTEEGRQKNRRISLQVTEKPNAA